jgi:polyisoprenoid-binding protein YceI
MRFSFLLVASLLFLPTLGFSATYQIDTAQSTIQWKATKVTGAHEGVIAIKSGNLRFEDGHFIGGRAEIDMATIRVIDIQNEEMNKKLVKHLKSDDFFNVEQHPEAKIEIKEVQPINDHEYSIVADLSIKDVTKPIKFIATVRLTEVEAIAQAEMTIDRTAFDIKYGSGKFFENLGDKMIHDEFTVTINIKALKNK